MIIKNNCVASFRNGTQKGLIQKLYTLNKVFLIVFKVILSYSELINVEEALRAIQLQEVKG